MRFLPPDEPVDLYETVFGKDLLGREKVSKTLSSVLDRIEDPLVVALDGRWGTGKSYFLKRWVGAHRKQNNGLATTVYFDAFASDYMTDPLIALVSALADRFPAAEDKKLDRVKRIAFKFIRPAARIGLAVVTAGASTVLGDIGDAAVEAAGGEASKAAADFWAREEGRQAAMEEFRRAITTLTETPGEDEPTPLVIVIDELDRCRPDYALEVLEVAKHFFAVPHVHFVLGVNLLALENSVKARYGSEIDATAYLQKFLSFTLSLPVEIGEHRRISVAVEYASQTGMAMGIPRHLREEICDQLVVLERFNHISIRDVGKILSTAALLPDEALGEHAYWGWRATAVTLIVTKVIRPEIFRKFVSTTISRDELVQYLGAYREFISPELENGQQNRKFNSKVLSLFGIWRYLCKDWGEGGADELGRYARLFDSVGDPGEVSAIPLKVNDDWLSVFRLS